MNISDKAKRLAITRLLNVADSPAPHALTAAAATLHGILTQSEPIQDHEFLAADDALAAAIAAMPGPLATHLDFRGILHGKETQISQHRIRNVSAALRDKTAQLGRLLTNLDFPSGHPVPLFALAYWGGVAAWSAGSADRVQRPKGYWTDRNNQIAAIRALAAAHPGTPVTHALVHAAGLHRLGLILNAEALQKLADEAGVDRNLSYRPGGWWTAERVIDAYAEACRRSGTTLSTTVLTAIGGETCSLKTQATSHFPTFDAFQRAVVARHPDIKLPIHPTAADGTRLDSWSEVPVYNALRRALPHASVKVHFILPGEKARSADFVIDDRVWVEVLGIACAAMHHPTSARQAKYAADWKAKSACYTALGIDPVLIEPKDIHDTDRLSARIAEIAARLQCNAQPLKPPSGQQTRAKGTWTFEVLCAAVAEVAGGSGTLPTFAALADAGFGHACCLLRQQGMRERVASALALADPNRKGVWTRDRVVIELAEWLREHGSYPTNAELKRSGRGEVCSARSRLWLGERAGLHKAVGEKAGMEARRRRAPDGSYVAIEQIAAVLTPLAMTLGRMPTAAEAAAAGMSTAWAHASLKIGVAAMAKLIGVPCTSRRRRSKAEMLDELSRLAASLGGARLTTGVIRARLGSGGVGWVRRCGGMAAVRAAIAAGSDSWNR